METSPNEMVNDAIDLAAMLHLMQSMTYRPYFERKVRRILHYALARLKACSRLCFRPSTSFHWSPVAASRCATLVILKSRGCASASSSHVSGRETGAP